MKIFEITLFGFTIAPTYYALMYIFGFLVAWVFMKKYFSFRKTEDLDNLFFAIGLGVIFGGRIGYILFYNFTFYLSNPLKIFAIWEWGMSFHGGLFGVILAVWIFAKMYKYSFWSLIDKLAIIAPIGLAFGRFGNFLNNELYGFSPYYGSFAMMVKGVPHFPSPLLEMVLEWFFLFIILFILFKKYKFDTFLGKLSGIFLIFYGVFRIVAEFFRLPDSQIWYIFGTNFLTAGMLYSLPMIIFGLYLILRKNKIL